MLGKRILVCVSLGAALTACAPQLPENTPFTEARWLEQNWSPDARYWFHHTTQGTSTLPVPYDWFVALEQPRLWLFGDPPMLKDSAYLRRFGFIPSPRSFDLDAAALGTYGYGPEDKAAYAVRAFAYDEAKFPGNPDGLPVGFARLKDARDPITDGKLPDQIGFTCAACHTGHLEYRGVSLRIDGAPALTDLEKFRESLKLALVYTKVVPFRFGRFADRVLGPGHTPQQEAALKSQLDALIEFGKSRNEITDPVFERNVEEGFARLDALNRIGNQVFFDNFLVPGGDKQLAIANLAPITAPVNYPHIWDTSWFLWVQYDASIMQPMVRNAGEALGVRAGVNLVNAGDTLYRSAVEVGEIFDLEQLLAGDDPFKGGGKPEFKGLRAPKWPGDLLGPIDAGKRDQGRKLYVEHCQECHLPAVNDPSGAFWDGKHWTPPDRAGQRYLELTEKPVDHIGTDPAQAAVMVQRRVKVPAHLEINPNELCGDEGGKVVTETLFALALGAVVEKTTEKWYDEHEVSRRERDRMNGHRPNCLRAKMIYKARPLDGIWATAPYLHNGSVPNLWALLSPVDERPETFCLGSRLFDPQKVGYSTECVSGAFELDTTKDGNRNTGHEFKDGPLVKGVFGPALSDEERMALIEYLKSL
ncbi:MAG: di-heme-cytochrome C peroxidase [Rhodospirillales bacterium]|nr:di-heme-cytochrome C peroxidase [Rhodospirillales bacterium]MDH3791094.1 di-heme-cytochrome C peroxidase [Rhodospirillales bacterium]MDH3919135.1 di-heme-cytochrome C peroxidase [Rhodospirillales bacterium]MDH3968446.1 di-heme-cytochrome C peroxidase [Rhodospirillales bacterium]